MMDEMMDVMMDEDEKRNRTRIEPSTPSSLFFIEL